MKNSIFKIKEIIVSDQENKIFVEELPRESDYELLLNHKLVVVV